MSARTKCWEPAVATERARQTSRVTQCANATTPTGGTATLATTVTDTSVAEALLSATTEALASKSAYNSNFPHSRVEVIHVNTRLYISYFSRTVTQVARARVLTRTPATSARKSTTACSETAASTASTANA